MMQSANRPLSPFFIPSLLSLLFSHTLAQNQCYYDAGAKGPSNLVPCKSSGQSACCLLGDICLSGNACWDLTTGDTYQYGCTDSSYQDSTCPYKCGWDSSKSPYTTLIYCSDIADPNNSNQNISDTWVCLSPESCGCDWGPSNTSLLVLPPRDCKDMGDQARVALSAPSVLAPWVSLPTSNGGSTGYFRSTNIGGTSSWAGPISGYTPNPIRELTTYQDGPSQVVIAGGGTVASPSSASSTSSASPSSPTSSSPASSTASSAPSTAVIPGSPTSGSLTLSTMTAPPSTSPTANFSPATASSSAPPASSTSASVAGSGDLSTGEKAGIGIAAAAAVLLLLALGLALWRRRQKRKANRTSAMPQHIPPPFIPPPPQQPMQEATLPYYNGAPQADSKTGSLRHGASPSSTEYYNGAPQADSKTALPLRHGASTSSTEYYNGAPQADSKTGSLRHGANAPNTEVQKMHAPVHSDLESMGSQGNGSQSMMFALGSELSQRPHDTRSLHSTRGPPTPSPAYEDVIRQS